MPTLLIDLDGTLVDSLGDLAASLAPALLARGAEKVTAAEIRPMVGDGIAALVSRAFAARGLAADDDAVAEVQRIYENHAARLTRLYPGAEAALDAASAAGIAVAICTNKPAEATLRLLTALGIADRFAAIGAGDSFAVRKPDPAHLTLTLERAGGSPGDAVMVGDHRNDVVAARGAGIGSIFAAWGYGDARSGEDADARATGWPEVLPLAVGLLR